MAGIIPVYHNGEKAGSIRARKRQPGTFEAFVNVNGTRERIGIASSVPEAQGMVRGMFETYQN